MALEDQLLLVLSVFSLAVVVGAVLMLAILMPLSGELGNRSRTAEPTPGVAPEPPHWPQDAGAESEES